MARHLAAPSVDVVVRSIESTAGDLENLHVRVTRDDFRNLCSNLDARVKGCIEAVLTDAAITPQRVDTIVLAGQGTKIFTVREAIERQFPGIPIEGRYQENDVALGMGRYTHTLGRLEKSVLLLDAIPNAIGIKCSEQDLTGPANINCRISPDAAKNTKTEILLRKDTSIPTRSSLAAELERGATAGDVVLKFVEVETGPRPGELRFRFHFPMGPRAFTSRFRATLQPSRSVSQCGSIAPLASASSACN